MKDSTPKSSGNTAIKHLTVFSLVMITVGAVDSIRNLPWAALFGAKVIGFYLVAALFFLVPAALVSAELASRHENGAGVYSWVKQAFGGRWGCMAVWLQWAENAPFFPAILSFIAGTLAYGFFPHWVASKTYLVLFVLISFWGLTFLNILGIRTSTLLSTLCAVVGMVLPMLAIMVMGLLWWWQGHPSAIDLHPSQWWPDWGNLSSWVVAQGIIISLCGVELATVHARNTLRPQTAFPRALLCSVFIILATLIAGSLAVGMIVPADTLQHGNGSLLTGVMSAFHVFLNSMGLGSLLPVFGVLLALGALGEVNSWIIAPTRGLCVAGQEGDFSARLSRTNRHEAPVPLLLLQAVVVSLIAMVYLLLPNINAGYWFVSVLAGQIYALMYVLMFVAAIVIGIRHKTNNTVASSGYRISKYLGGLVGVSVLGLVGSVCAFLICFIPPERVGVGSHVHYLLLLTGCLLALVVLPWFLLQRRSPKGG